MGRLGTLIFRPREALLDRNKSKVKPNICMNAMNNDCLFVRYKHKTPLLIRGLNPKHIVRAIKNYLNAKAFLTESGRLGFSRLETISTSGRTGIYFIAEFEGKKCFIKLNTRSVAKKNIYQKEAHWGSICSRKSSHFLSVLKYIDEPRYEVIVFPYVPGEDLYSCPVSVIAENIDEFKKQVAEIRTFLRNEKLQHNDLHGGQLFLTFSENKLDKIYLIDLANMTQCDDSSPDNDGKFFQLLDTMLETKLSEGR